MFIRISGIETKGHTLYGSEVNVVITGIVNRVSIAVTVQLDFILDLSVISVNGNGGVCSNFLFEPDLIIGPLFRLKVRVWHRRSSAAGINKVVIIKRPEIS